MNLRQEIEKITTSKSGCRLINDEKVDAILQAIAKRNAECVGEDEKYTRIKIGKTWEERLINHSTHNRLVGRIQARSEIKKRLRESL